MSIKPLTKTQVEKAKAEDRKYNLADGFGLYLRVSPSGNKSWLFRYKNNQGKIAHHTIGRYPEFSLDEARDERFKLRKLLSRGEDIKEYFSKQSINQVTLKEVAKSWLEVKASEVTNDYLDDIERSLINHIFPAMGQLPISEITPPLLVKVLKPIEKQGKMELIKRLCSRLNAIFDHAVGGGLIKYNPLIRIRSQFKSHTATNLPTLHPLTVATILTFSLLKLYDSHCFSINSFSVAYDGKACRSFKCDMG